ncbi:ATP synthase F1 subunit delta [bacterium]|nr:ATP synthase F1 subunit delta [bacterium]
MYRSLVNRYADAVIASAHEKNLEEETYLDLETLSDLFPESRENLQILQRADDMQGAAKELGKALCDLLEPGEVAEHLIEVLSEKRRLEMLPIIVNETIKKLKKIQGIVLASVTSIRVLDPDEKQKIQSRLNQLTKRQVEIEWQLDSSVLGGLCIRIGDRIIDGTLKTRMKKLQEHLVRSQGE